ncbi:MAG: hypothetical protein DUD26_05535 [Eubacteriaceae bacterium]|nr:MAG: hypothetical protein DUD26_05535 [Eubacteriaceae bacterium]
MFFTSLSGFTRILRGLTRKFKAITKYYLFLFFFQYNFTGYKTALFLHLDLHSFFFCAMRL